MSMKELVRETGVHRQTIHHYLREGVLPPPVQGAGTHRARYGGAHVELLGVIRELRDREGLSLDAIRRRFEQAAFDPERLAHRGLSRGVSFEPPEGSGERLDRGRLSGRAKAPPLLVDALVEHRMIQPDPEADDEIFDGGHVAVVRAVHRMVEAGFEIDDALRVARSARAITTVDVARLAKEATSVSAQAARDRAAEPFRVVGELVDALRRQMVGETLHLLSQLGPRAQAYATEAVYTPSPLFLRRHGTDKELRSARALAVINSSDVGLWCRVGRLLLAMGRFVEAAQWLGQVADRDPPSAELFALMGVARSMSGAVESGISAAKRSVALDPSSPRARVFLGITLALEVATLPGVHQMSERMRLAFHHMSASRDLCPANDRERLEVLVARGRMLVVLASDPDARQRGLADLLELYERAAAGADGRAGFEYPGATALYRGHAAYFLGIMAMADGRPLEALTFLETCIALDPASTYAERAFDQATEIRASSQRGD